MAGVSGIEWTDGTWNPVRGCSRISPGCEHCYAERIAQRFSGLGQPYEGLTRGSRSGPRWTGRIRLVDDAIDAPLHWRKSKLVFVNSMSDLFHEQVPLAFIERVFETMERAHWHTFQILTKRADRLAALAARLPWPANVWMGVSVESERYLERVDHLRAVPAAVRFLSLEPLLGPLPNLDLDGVDWVIVGGESGPGARAMSAEWVREIRRKCELAGVPFFFKQWGGLHKKRAGRELDGRTHDAMPPLAESRVLAPGAVSSC
jgi:protein gp37